jgi:hypothetical protein
MAQNRKDGDSHGHLVLEAEWFHFGLSLVTVIRPEAGKIINSFSVPRFDQHPVGADAQQLDGAEVVAFFDHPGLTGLGPEKRIFAGDPSNAIGRGRMTGWESRCP